MCIREIAILLGCHGFDDFPVHHEGDDAESLLASWTSLWHPHLIAACGKTPVWHRVDSPPEERDGCLWVVPQPYAGDLSGKIDEELAARGGRVIRAGATRDSILQQAFTSLNVSTDSPPSLSDDFLALGYAFLQIELLTRQMRYSTSVDETTFEQCAVEAAKAAVAGDETTAREKLQSCFDFLAQERDHYYAVDVLLLDVTLVEPSLSNSALVRQLSGPTKSNVMLTAQSATEIAAGHQETFQALRAALDAKQVGIIGGEFSELPLSLLSTETIRQQLALGLNQLEESFGCRPTVFGRRRFGLTPCLPQLLNKMGFRGALHATFDGGQFPEATQSKSRWEGDCQVGLDAIVRAPLDASQPTTFLNFAGNISESMDMDHVATRCFAHWAGVTSPWYEELQRVASYTSALGRFVTIDEYFDETYDAGMHEKFTADQYRSPRLTDSISSGQRRVISASIDYWRQHLLIQSLLNCTAMHVLIDNQSLTRQKHREAVELSERFAKSAIDDTKWRDEEPGIRDRLQGCARELAALTAGGEAASSGTGLAVVNPLGFPRRIAVLDGPLPEVPSPIKNVIYATHKDHDLRQLVVDAPGWGGVIVGDSAAARGSRGKVIDLVEELSVRNEFVEAQIDEATGALRSLRDYSTRGNRLSQQLVMHQGGDASQRYTKMVAESVTVTKSTPVVGEIVSRGSLMAGETAVAAFVQTYRLLRGSRVLQVTIQLDPHEEPAPDPWNSYFACRFAWSNEASDLSRGLNDIRRPTTAKRIEAPLFIQIDDGQCRTALLTGGLPFHRRIGRRMLDSLLIVRGEEQREFTLGMGLDLKQPFREAQAMIAPEPVVSGLPVEPGARSHWLFHVDAPNAIVTGCEPSLEGDTLTGLKMRLIEAEGRPGRVSIRSFRALREARKTDFTGQTITQCEVDGDKLSFQMSAHELTEVALVFADA